MLINKLIDNTATRNISALIASLVLLLMLYLTIIMVKVFPDGTSTSDMFCQISKEVIVHPTGIGYAMSLIFFYLVSLFIGNKGNFVFDFDNKTSFEIFRIFILTAIIAPTLAILTHLDSHVPQRTFDSLLMNYPMFFAIGFPYAILAMMFSNTVFNNRSLYKFCSAIILFYSLWLSSTQIEHIIEFKQGIESECTIIKGVKNI